jgi:hypothetical protein
VAPSSRRSPICLPAARGPRRTSSTLGAIRRAAADPGCLIPANKAPYHNLTGRQWGRPPCDPRARPRSDEPLRRPRGYR